MPTCRRTLFIIRMQTIFGIDILFAYFFFRNLVQRCLLDCYLLIPFSSFFCNFMILFLVWRIAKLDNYILICNVTKHFTNKYLYFITYTYFIFLNNFKIYSVAKYSTTWSEISNMLSNLKMMYVNLHEL